MNGTCYNCWAKFTRCRFSRWIEGHRVIDTSPNAAQRWDASLYQDRFQFVTTGGEPLIDMLQPGADMRILDLGCGDGKLTARLAEFGAEVVGCDHSGDMLEKARAQYPNLRFELADGHALPYHQQFDAVFSNAALHWMLDHDAVLNGVFRALRPGGRFVAEFGGAKNVAGVTNALQSAAQELGLSIPRVDEVWRFPTSRQFVSTANRAGLRQVRTHWFRRPSRLEGESGFRDWLAMFGGPFMAHLAEGDRAALISGAEGIRRPLAFRDGGWTIDYARLRIEAVRPE